MRETFVQIGSTRDGREPYLHAARRRGMRDVLVERPEYLALRSAAGRAEFEESIAVSAPNDADTVWQRLQKLGPPRLILAGFERYTPCAHALASRIDPARGGFRPPTKREQRAALARHAPEIAQPQFSNPCDPGAVSYPAVLKPVDGGGGLGVLLLSEPAQLRDALDYGRRLSNYDGAPLQEWILEEYIDAPEWSVQGVCCAGACHILAICSKVVAREPVAGMPGVMGFREVAHIATGPATVGQPVRRFVGRALAAVGYANGPFHLDFRQDSEPVFIEMGFRLSGAAVTDLVRAVSGCNWGEAAFSWMLGEGHQPASGPGVVCAGNILAFSERQISFARRVIAPDAIRIERFATPASLLPVETARALEADLSRHAGPVARIQIHGDDPDLVRRIATKLSTLRCR